MALAILMSQSARNSKVACPLRRRARDTGLTSKYNVLSRRPKKGFCAARALHRRSHDSHDRDSYRILTVLYTLTAVENGAQRLCASDAAGGAT